MDFHLVIWLLGSQKITPINATTDSITYSVYVIAMQETDHNADIIMSVPSLVDVYEANGLINGMCRSAPLLGWYSFSCKGSNIVYGTGNCNFVSDFILGENGFSWK